MDEQKHHVILSQRAVTTDGTVTQKSNRFVVFETIDEFDEEVEEVYSEEALIKQVTVGIASVNLGVEEETRSSPIDPDGKLLIQNDAQVDYQREENSVDGKPIERQLRSEGEIDDALVEQSEPGELTIKGKRGRKTNAERHRKSILAKAAEVLKGLYRLSFLIILEPMLPIHKWDEIRRELAFDRGFSSRTSKIWVFFQDDFAVLVLEDHEQVLHMEIHCRSFPETFYVSAVYAKSTRQAREFLWTNLVAFRDRHASVPRMVVGDFNLSSVGVEFTWGGTRQTGWISKKLDTVLLSSEWGNCFRRSGFLEVVRVCWEEPVAVYGMLAFSWKLRQLKRVLKEWNKPIFGNVFDSLKKEDVKVQTLEGVYDWDPSEDSRVKLHEVKAWKFHNEVLFEGVVVSDHVLVRKITNDVSDILRVHVMPSKLIEELEFLERHFHVRNGRVLKRNYIPVCWKPPLEGSIILNRDGSSRDHGAGYGFLIRGGGGIFVYGELGFLGDVDSFEAEIAGLLFLLRKSELLSLHPVLVQTDNKVLMELLKMRRDSPWQHISSLSAILAILDRPFYSIEYLYREANAVANNLAMRASDCLCQVFTSLKDLPIDTKGLVILDQRSFPYVHFRKT
ncbi:OLC1v1004916C1 [Oldenlandia corymbosa var. corymbosa]|uniref:OLC1v1004916C1 n=1 Tax=Oldenlandia corymbosa var. corymbosa TaxID=529605 RepID=A0AAV1DDE2_OLDCO|nr:OLC1v1004916C1 [Oldenlandia corymbosa var. corymbosa]